jgi:hypothetical protein
MPRMYVAESFLHMVLCVHGMHMVHGVAVFALSQIPLLLSYFSLFTVFFCSSFYCITLFFFYYQCVIEDTHCTVLYGWDPKSSYRQRARRHQRAAATREQPPLKSCRRPKEQPPPKSSRHSRAAAIKEQSPSHQRAAAIKVQRAAAIKVQPPSKYKEQPPSKSRRRIKEQPP